MSTKTKLAYASKLINNFIYSIGCFTIVSYGFEHWPITTEVFTITFVAAFLVWYLWYYFVKPFRAALRGESQ